MRDERAPTNARGPRTNIARKGSSFAEFRNDPSSSEYEEKGERDGQGEDEDDDEEDDDEDDEDEATVLFLLALPLARWKVLDGVPRVLPTEHGRRDTARADIVAGIAIAIVAEVRLSSQFQE